MLKRLLKNERGLTLIELLAVVVILGIIAAIAIPAIGGLIDNSKKDAHVSNAQQMINAAKIAVTADKDLIPADGKKTAISLHYLESKGYLETVKSPDGSGYKKNDSSDNNSDSNNDLRTDLTADPASSFSYVLISNSGNKLSYAVKLITGERGIQGNGGTAVAESDLKRDKVVKLQN
jgi:type IV pilus assembly protein PilA